MSGAAFERAVVEMLGKYGYWAHRIAPDARGAQPFDIIAVGSGRIIAADCKVCQSGKFQLSRFEENQRYAFKLFHDRNSDCWNIRIGIFAYYNGVVYWIPYWKLLQNKDIKLSEEFVCEFQLEQK